MQDDCDYVLFQRSHKLGNRCLRLRDGRWSPFVLTSNNFVVYDKDVLRLSYFGYDERTQIIDFSSGEMERSVFDSVVIDTSGAVIDHTPEVGVIARRYLCNKGVTLPFYNVSDFRYGIAYVCDKTSSMGSLLHFHSKK